MKGWGLEKRWLALLEYFDVPSEGARAAFGEVARRYRQEQRVYHTLAHVQYVLEVVARLAEEAEHPLRVQVAAWLHDVVYDPQAGNNEERSADYAARLLGKLGLTEEVIADVQRLILHTKAHQAQKGDGDACVLLDADLAILGEAPATYRTYARAIRREYGWLSEEAYREGRIEVLEGFLAREHIYCTSLLRAEREAQARRNLAQEIDTLS